MGCGQATGKTVASEVEEEPPGPQLRQRKSFRLEESEESAAAKAAAAFEKGSDDGFTLARREDWPKFKELLAQGAQLREAAGQCELESDIDRALAKYKAVVMQLLRTLRSRATAPKEEAFLEDTFVSPALRGCAFVGHVATDMDSIAGAIGAAELFDGVATKSEAGLNGEIAYVLKEVAKIEEPALFDDCPGCGKPDATGKLRKVCLVDHNDEKQMVPSLRNSPDRRQRIVGLIDHHALADSFSSDSPLLIDLRPWGSMSTIVAHLFIRNNVMMRAETARALMCAILSDTLNLQSVTTTSADRFAVALLAQVGGVEDPDEVARLMFRAKTTWIVNLGPYSMVRGDQKDFSADGWKFGISVLEVTDVQPVLAVAAELIFELRALKKEKGGGSVANELDFAFLFVVDVVKQCSVLLVCGGREQALAQAAFPGCPFGRASPGIAAPGKTITAEQTICDVGPLVSRKAQFVPLLSKALNAGFTCHKERVTSTTYKQGADDDTLDNVLKSDEAAVVVDGQQIYTRKSVTLHTLAA